MQFPMRDQKSWQWPRKQGQGAVVMSTLWRTLNNRFNSSGSMIWVLQFHASFTAALW
jgi:hypothetical protein